jgi:uracil-DNA glycosylase family 4
MRTIVRRAVTSGTGEDEVHKPGRRRRPASDVSRGAASLGVGPDDATSMDSRSALVRPTPTLASVHADIVGCERCPRLREYCRRVGVEKRRAFREDTYWARPVPGFGDPDAALLLIGLAPAAHGANRTGRVFTGDGEGGSGDFLMSALHRAGFANMPTSRHPGDGLQLRNAFIAAAVRCAPPGNRPTLEEIASSQPHGRAESGALTRLRVIVALGRIAFDAFVRHLRSAGVTLQPRPQFAHGSVAELANGQTLIGCYHPSRQNTNTGRLSAAMMDDVFGTARRKLSGTFEGIETTSGSLLRPARRPNRPGPSHAVLTRNRVAPRKS